MSKRIMKLVYALAAGLALVTVVTTLFNSALLDPAGPAEPAYSAAELAYLHGWSTSTSAAPVEPGSSAMIVIAGLAGAVLLIGVLGWLRVARLGSGLAGPSRPFMATLLLGGSLVYLLGLGLVVFAPSRPAVAQVDYNLARNMLTLSSTAIISPVTTFSDGVGNNGNCTLREAIIAANTDTQVDLCPAGNGADTIPLQAGTYQLSLAGQDEDLTQTGDLDITEDLTIIGQGDTLTLVDGGSLDRVFDVRNDSRVTFTNLKVQNGGGNVFGGGGILNGGILTLTNVTVFSNTGDQGGGIYNATGGSSDSLTLINSLVTSNTGDLGGGICNINGAPLTVISSTISNNRAVNDGGGIYHLSPGEITLLNSTVSGNIATDNSGGIDNGGPGAVVVISSAIDNNRVNNGNGGGISNRLFATALAVTNTTLSGNQASNNGGGIYHEDGLATLNNVTLANNIADSDNAGGGDGGGIFRGVSSDTVHLKNTIVAANTDNSAATQQPDCSGALASQGYNLIGDNSGCTGLTNGVNGDKVGTAGTPLDPLLAPLTGSPAYHSLLSSNSPAFDAGNPATPGSGGNACAATDQRGLSRPQSTACDIGAIEFILPAELVLRKTGPATATAGSLVTYTLTVSNIGDEPINNLVTITDAVPVGASFVQATNGGSLLANGQVLWSLANLPARGETQVQFSVTATQTIVNRNYRASAGSLSATGSPVVTTTITGGGGADNLIYLPILLKN